MTFYFVGSHNNQPSDYIMLLADSKSKSTVFRNRFDSFKITIWLRNNQPPYLTISRAVFYILHCMTTTVEYNELYRGEIGELQEESSEKSRDMRILKNGFRGPPNNQLTDYNHASSRLAPWLQHDPSPIISLSSTDWGSKESWVEIYHLLVNA